MCVVAFCVNFILFALKLYIGFASNSISIYSDGVNNLFDSLSGLLSVVCFWFVAKGTQSLFRSPINKIEQFLSFILSVLVAGAGFVFAYSSLERLMYPTPIWFLVKYLWILVGTAAVKLLLFVFFKKQHKKTGSQVIRILAFDSLLDFFVTAVTIMGFVISNNGSYAVDAFCGVLVSVVIMISAAKLIVSSCKKLTDYTDNKTKQELEAVLAAFGINGENAEVSFLVEEKVCAHLKAEFEIEKEKQEELKRQVEQKTGIQLYIVY